MKKSVNKNNYPSSSSSRTTPNRQRRKFPCQNHQNKAATHILQSQQTQQALYYCEKCSIMLASQGFNVMRIYPNSSSNAPTPNNRFLQIEEFIHSLQHSLKMLSLKYTQNEQKLLESQEYYAQLHDEVCQYFKQIQDTIELQKYMAYNALLNHRQKNEHNLRQLHTKNKQAILQIQTMMDDIKNNLEAVQNVDYQIYASIIRSYQEKLQNVPLILNAESRFVEKLKIKIPQIPLIINQLSEMILPNNDIHRNASTRSSRLTISKNQRSQYHNIASQQRKPLSTKMNRIKTLNFEDNENKQNDKRLTQKYAKIKDLAFSFDSKGRQSVQPEERSKTFGKQIFPNSKMQFNSINSMQSLGIYINKHSMIEDMNQILDVSQSQAINTTQTLLIS